AVWPLAARAQQSERMRKVGLLMGIESDPDARARVKALRQRLGELGWSEDRNIRTDVVWGAGDADHVRADAAELIRQSPDVIVTNGPVPTTEAGKATPAIPIVFVQVPDPVDLGIVASLARPGRNITGFTHFDWRSRENGWRRSRTWRRRRAVSSSSRSPSIPRCPDSCARSRLWSHLPARKRRRPAFAMRPRSNAPSTTLHVSQTAA